MNLILHPTYFPNIAHFVALVKGETIFFEAQDNYTKQTYRNRTYIYAANGRLALNIPVRYTQKNRQKYQDVIIANEENWQELHWKSLLSAYRTSPFFEFYEDALAPLFHKPKHQLFEFNLECIQTIYNCLDIDFEYELSSEYVKVYKDKKDYRLLVNAKKEDSFSFENYTQVFYEKHGFISNLSILDLLFNEGPNSLNYLESQSL